MYPRKTYYPRRRNVQGRGPYFYRPAKSFLSYARGAVRGRGPYSLSDVWKRVRSYIPRAVGAAAGGALYGPGGAAKGYAAGAALSKKVLGWGPYNTSAGSVWQETPDARLVSQGNVPKMGSIANGIRISHRECIGTILSTVGFGVNKYRVNPALNSTFPWLSGIAKNFQSYDIIAMMVLYESSVSDSISSGTVSSMGSVVMTYEANPYIADPTNAVSMLGGQYAVSGKPSSALCMPVEQDRKRGGKLQNNLLIRYNDAPSGASLANYDDGVLFIATDNNGVADVELGKIYLTYDIRFFNAITPPAGSSIPYGHYYMGSTPTTNNILGSSWTLASNSIDSVGLTRNSSTQFTLDRGNVGTYMLMFVYYVGSGLINVPGALSYSNCSLNNTFTLNSGAHYVAAPNTGETVTSFVYQLYIDIPDPTLAASVTISDGTLTGAVVSSDIIVMQVNPEIA